MYILFIFFMFINDLIYSIDELPALITTNSLETVIKNEKANELDKKFFKEPNKLNNYIRKEIEKDKTKVYDSDKNTTQSAISDLSIVPKSATPNSVTQESNISNAAVQNEKFSEQKKPTAPNVISPNRELNVPSFNKEYEKNSKSAIPKEISSKPDSLKSTTPSTIKTDDEEYIKIKKETGIKKNEDNEKIEKDAKPKPKKPKFKDELILRVGYNIAAIMDIENSQKDIKEDFNLKLTLIKRFDNGFSVGPGMAYINEPTLKRVYINKKIEENFKMGFWIIPVFLEFKYYFMTDYIVHPSISLELGYPFISDIYKKINNEIKGLFYGSSSFNLSTEHFEASLSYVVGFFGIDNSKLLNLETVSFGLAYKLK